MKQREKLTPVGVWKRLCAAVLLISFCVMCLRWWRGDPPLVAEWMTWLFLVCAVALWRGDDASEG